MLTFLFNRSEAGQSAWLAISPSMWAFAVSGFTIVFTSVPAGRGVIGWTRLFLEIPIFSVGARLVFSMYLVHVPLMFWWLAWWTHPVSFSPASITLPYMGFVFSSIIAAMGVYLLVSAALMPAYTSPPSIGFHC